MAAQKKRRSKKAARDESTPPHFLPADPPSRSPVLLTLSIILLLGWLGLLAWIVARII
jgi:hypothetical protein